MWVLDSPAANRSTICARSAALNTSSRFFGLPVLIGFPSTFRIADWTLNTYESSQWNLATQTLKGIRGDDFGNEYLFSFRRDILDHV